MNSAATATARFLDLRQASALTSLSVSTLRRLIRRGRLAGYRPVPGRVLVEVAELEALVKAARK